MSMNIRAGLRAFLLLLVSWLGCSKAWADAVTDWNTKAGMIVTEAKGNAQIATRVLAIMHTAAYEATNAITQRYATGLKLEAAPGA